MTPEIEAALKGHPDTITAHGILAREITDLRTRLAASEAECLEQARLNGMGSEREAALLARVEAAEAQVESYVKKYPNAREVNAEMQRLEAQVASLQAALAAKDKEFAILIEAMKAIAYDDPCGQHHDAMAQDALRLAYNVSDDDFCAKPQEGDAGQP